MAAKTTLLSFPFALTIITLIPLNSYTCYALKPTHHATTTTTNVDFIRNSCKNTGYPNLCYNSLSSYASTIQRNPIQLADAALTVSLNKAKATTGMMTKLYRAKGKSSSETGALSDCMDTMADSVAQLQQSLQTMGQLKGKDFKLKVNDVQTWVSSALTDESTCMDGLPPTVMKQGEVSVVRSQIVKVAKLTSNALALVNALANL